MKNKVRKKGKCRNAYDTGLGVFYCGSINNFDPVGICWFQDVKKQGKCPYYEPRYPDDE